jgi:hypothetical protein
MAHLWWDPLSGPPFFNFKAKLFCGFSIRPCLIRALPTQQDFLVVSTIYALSYLHCLSFRCSFTPQCFVRPLFSSL